MAFPSNRLQFIALGTVFLVAGAVSGVWSYHRAKVHALEGLAADARHCAAAFSSEEIAVLSDARPDLAKPMYDRLRARLTGLLQTNSTATAACLVRYQPSTGMMTVLADTSQTVAQPEPSVLDEARSPGFRSFITNGQMSAAGPKQTPSGEWMSAYAQLKTATAESMILGLDVPAAHWRRILWAEGLLSTMRTWLLLTLPLGVLALLRRQNPERKVRHLLSAAVKQSGSAILIVDPANRIEYVSQGVCDQIGYARDELIGRDWNVFRAEPPAEQPSRPAGQSWEDEWLVRRKDGEIYPVQGVVSPVHGAGGRILCFIVTLRDMSTVKRAEEELRAAKERAEAGARTKGEFLATMGHELRTPLNGIVRFASLLRDTPLIPEQREYIQTICSSSEALLKLTGDLLDYSWLEAGRLPLDIQPCDPREVIEDVLDLVSGQAAGKDLVLLHQVAPEVPTVAELDPGRLRQVLVNLLGNAVKFTACGEVAVTANVRQATGLAEGEVIIEFTIRDTGPGIEPANVGRLFQPFSRLVSARHPGGTGLGLAISRSLVRLMGGEISLESTPGKGTVFRFFIAARPVYAPPAPLMLANRKVGLVVSHPGLLHELATVIAAAGGSAVPCPLEGLGGAETDFSIVDCDPEMADRLMTGALKVNWPISRTLGLITNARNSDERRLLRPLFRSLLTKPLHHGALVNALLACLGPSDVTRMYPQLELRLLLVDDNPANLRLLQSIIGVLGCECTMAAGGREGLDAIRQGGPYDAVMLDLQMPEVDGMEVVRRLRAGEVSPETKNIWITIVTADNRPETRAALFALGCDDFITKPVTVKSCLEALQRVKRGRLPDQQRPAI
ncbi:MAG: response regulator [Verrucomicrobia bacterium]|nr:response regulator [Verrucomicrobiota bacterium]